MRAPRKDSHRQEIVALAERGISQAEIRKKLGLTKGYVHFVLACAGVGSSPKPSTVRRQANEHAFKLLRQRNAKLKNPDAKDPRYLAWIRCQECVCCKTLSREAWAELPREKYRIEAAHVGERGIGRKCPDAETLPICSQHHTRGRDSHHRLGKGFWEHWNLDRDVLVKEHRERYRAEVGRVR